PSDLPSFPTRRSSDLAVSPNRQGPPQPCREQSASLPPRLLRPCAAGLDVVYAQRRRSAATRLRLIYSPAFPRPLPACPRNPSLGDRKSTRLNSSHVAI